MEHIRAGLGGRSTRPDARVDLLPLDEPGFVELDKRGAELQFQVLTEREEKNAIAIASNEGFSGWTKTLPDPRRVAHIRNQSQR